MLFAPFAPPPNPPLGSTLAHALAAAANFGLLANPPPLPAPPGAPAPDGGAPPSGRLPPDGGVPPPPGATGQLHAVLRETLLEGRKGCSAGRRLATRRSCCGRSGPAAAAGSKEKTEGTECEEGTRPSTGAVRQATEGMFERHGWSR